MPKLNLDDKNYSAEVLSYYLWGQESAPEPSEMASEKWIDRTDVVTLEVDPDQFAQKYGHLVNAKDFRLTEVFFSGKTSMGNTLDIANAKGYSLNANGEYVLTQEQFANLYYVDDQTPDPNGRSNLEKAEEPVATVSLYDRGMSDADYAKVAFVFGTVSVAIDDDVRYILDEDLNPIRIENFDLIINTNVDNFDFTGGKGSSTVNQILNQIADPSGIGKTVKLDFSGGAEVKTSILTKDDYDSLESLSDNNPDYDLFLDEFERIRDMGVIDYLDEYGKLVIFDGKGDNNIKYTQADNFDLSEDVNTKYNDFLDELATFWYNLNHYKEHLDEGITYVGSDGADKIIGTREDDILYATDNTNYDDDAPDTLMGNLGFDIYMTGNGDTIYDSDGEGMVFVGEKFLTGGTKVCTDGSNADDAGVYMGNGGIYVWSEDHTLTFTNSEGTVTIEDWDNGDLGIHLEKQCEPSPEHVPCPSPTNPLVFPYLPLPSKPSYSSGGGSSGGGSSGAGGYYGGVSGGGSGDYHKSLYHEPECYISPVHSSAGAGGGGGSTGPIVLDLNHNGITSLSIAASSALFDYDGDGLRENTAWIESGDALLVSDLNSDGIINDASELFGNYTKLSNGSYAKSGYQALSEYDTNGDGVIDTNDGGYGELKLWIDSNGDGITDAGELVSLADAGVSSVTLSDEQFVPTLEAGNTIVQETSFTDANGEGVARDILFRYENTSQTDEGVYFDMDANGIQEKMTTWTQPNQWLVVKDLNGDGKITSGKEVLGNHFVLSDGTTATDTMAAIKSLDVNHDGKIDVDDHSGIAFWTDRNHNGVTDVGELEALGNPGAIQVIKLNYFQVLLGAYSGRANGVINSEDRLFDYIYLEKNSDDTFTLFLPESDAARAMIKDYTGNETITTSEGDVVVRNIQFYSGYEMQLNDELIGTDESETLEGSRSGERIVGGGGRDIIDAKAGNDIIEGGTGSDKLIGGSGDDTYIYNRGDGRDLIVESSGVDTISFGEGITSDDLIIKSNGVDISIYLKVEGKSLSELTDQIIIKDWYGTGRVESFVFKDGSTLDSGDVTLLFASDKNDTIYGTNGDDTLAGARGNDVLIDNNGNDTYIFNRGDGEDIILDTYGADTLQFGEGITQDDLLFQTIGSDLVVALKEDGVAFGDLNDKIIIKDWYAVNHRVESIEFDDKTILTIDNISQIMATEGDDVLVGDNNSNTIDALGGNDVIDAGGGDDIIEGGEGNDTLQGGAGNDTYIFNRGDGQDIIEAYSPSYYYPSNGTDTLQFGEGITQDDLLFQTIGSDLVVALKEDGVAFEDLSDMITLKDWYDPNSMTENIIFSSGETLTYSDIAQFMATDGDDIIQGTESSETISALDGNDTINAGSGNDIIYGGAGDDVIDAGNGNNLIQGGIGNDAIYGGYDNDTYIFNRGDGQDTIKDNSSSWNYNGGDDILQFGEDITQDDLIFKIVGDNLVIALKEDGVAFEDLSDTITIKDYYSWHDRSEIENIKFTNGDVLHSNDIIAMMSSENNDILRGTNGSDVINALDGNDTVDAEDGNDTLQGGKGNDTLKGGDGNDTYIFNRGDGQDIIDDNYTNYTNNDNNDILQFGEGITQDDLIFKTSGDDLIVALKEDGVAFEDLNDVVTIKNWYNDSCMVENIKLNDDTLLTSNDVIAYFITEEDDVIRGTKNSETISALAGDDTIDAGSGNNIINAGRGNDTILAKYGSDTYIFNRGDGKDTIYDHDYYNSNNSDTLQFGEGITQDDLLFQTLGNDLIVALKEAGVAFEDLSDTITIKDWYNSYYRVENIELSDGTVLGATDIVNSMGSNEDDIIKGTEKSETINAGAGNDTIYGGAGNDTYIFNRGDGQDTIKDNSSSWNYNGGDDTLQFGEGITQDDLLFQTLGNDLMVALKEDGVAFENLSDMITIKDWYSFNYRVENIKLSDGTILSRDDVTASFESEGDDTIKGTDENDIINAGSGNDTVDAGYGDDSIEGATGSDTLQGGYGNDIYIFSRGDGEDIILDTYGADTLQFGEGIAQDDLLFQASGNDLIVALKEDGVAFEDLSDTITIKDWYDSYSRIENIKLSDGTVLTSDDVVASFASEGDDIIKGTENSETINAGAGDDIIDAGVGENIVDAGDGNDIINAGSNNDILQGGLGDDIVNAGKGNDIIEGGLGNDTLQGGAGNDTYIFNRGDGKDTIEDVQGNDTLQFGEGITQDDLIFQTSGNDLIVALKEDGVAFEDLSDTITIKDWLVVNNRVENINFEDGTTWSVPDIVSHMGTAEADTIEGTELDDIIYAKDGDDIINGNDGNDTLYGQMHNDVINGGKGDDVLEGNLGNDILNGDAGNDVLKGNEDNDILYGGAGNDTYIFNRGDGLDEIYDLSGVDTLQFDEDITQNDLMVISEDDNLIIKLKEDGKTLEELSDGVFLRDWYLGDNRIENIELSDGTLLTQNDVVALMATESDDTIKGTENDEIIEGGLGNDILEGGAGNDTYIFNRGDGQDEIYDLSGVDTLQFGEGIVENDLIFQTSGDDLIVVLKEDGVAFENLSDKVTLKDWYLDDNKIENIRLSDGSSVAIGGQNYITGTEESETIEGTDENDVISGLGGDDTLQGGWGNDTYIFNRGDGFDEIYDLSGVDTLQFGEGITQDDLIFIADDSGMTILLKEESKSIEELSEGVFLQNWHSVDNMIEKIAFDDGTILLKDEIIASTITEGDDDILGTGRVDFIDALDGDDTIDAGEANDTVMGGAGNDILNGELGDDILKGEAGDDTIDGGYNNDILEGGLGNDTLYGGSGNDIYIYNRGDGQDVIYNYATSYFSGVGNDTLQFGEGIMQDDLLFKTVDGDLIVALKEDGVSFEDLSDTITLNSWCSSDDRVENIKLSDGTAYSMQDIVGMLGTEGDDSIQGTNDDDIINAGSGNDTVDAGSGNDIIEGGTGNDTLQGGYGDDTYIFNRGDGQDVINDYNYNGIDTLQFGEGIMQDDLLFQASGNDLIVALKEDGVAFEDLSDAITIQYWYYGNRMQNIELNDGTILSSDDILALMATEGDDNIRGTSDNDIINALGGDDTIDAGSGNDIIEGGTGNDTLQGGYGDDIYIYNRGDGTDTIYDYDYSSNNNDTLQFGEGITRDDLVFKVEGINLMVALREDGKSFEELTDKIILTDWFLSNNRVESFILDGGEKVDLSILFDEEATDDDNVLQYSNDNDVVDALGGDDIVLAGAGDDIIEGGIGNDILFGGDGDDIYIFNRGDGQDTIYEEYSRNGNALQFGEGVTIDDIEVQLVWKDLNTADLVIALKEDGVAFENLSDTITVSDWSHTSYMTDIYLSSGEVYNIPSYFGVYPPIGEAPIVFDLNGNEITSIALNSSNTYFDYDGNGNREHTAWIERGDALLAVDINNDGIINDGSELFGNHTKLPDGSSAQDGYEALQQYDSNNDGVIDENDAGFDKLLLWRDTNLDGQTAEDEISTLQANGIVSISLSPNAIYALEKGNQITYETTYGADAGTNGLVRDLWFQYNSQDTMEALSGDMSESGSFSDSFDDFETNTTLEVDSVKWIGDSEISSITLQSYYTRGSIDGTTAQTVFEGVGYSGTLSNIWLKSDPVDTQYTYNKELSDEVSNLPNAEGQGNVVDLQDAMNEESNLADSVQEFQALVESDNLNNLEDNIDSLIEQWALYDLGGDTTGYTPPIILDLNGDLVTSVALEDSKAYFDYDGDGRREHTAWVQESDGILVYDKDENGVITDGSELFGNYMKNTDGTVAGDGYEAMRFFDSDDNGVLNEQDVEFSNLKLWIDANGNGKNDSGELVSLADQGILEIDLDSDGGTTFTATDENGNIITNQTNYSSSGDDGIVRDIWFKYDIGDSIAYSTLSDSDEKKISIVENFYGRELNIEERHSVEVIAEVLRQYDAVKYDTIAKIITDRLYGEDFPNCTYLHNALNNTLARIVYGDATTAEVMLGSNLLASLLKTNYYTTLKYLDFEYLEDSNISYILAQNDINLSVNTDGHIEGNIGNTYFGSKDDENYDLSARHNIRLSMNDGNDQALGTDGVDVIDGGQGDDYIDGNGGKDVLIGGQGDDTLIGGIDQNVYMYSWGDGNDIIYDAGGEFDSFDTLRFKNIDIDMIAIERIGDDMVIHILNEIGNYYTPFGEPYGTITIKDGYASGQIEYFYFDDTRYTIDEVLNLSISNSVYHFNIGDGSINIADIGGEADSLYFGEGINSKNIEVRIDGDNLMIGIIQEGKSFDEYLDIVTIEDYATAIENFYFEDGETLSLSGMVNLAGVGLEGDENNDAPEAFNDTVEAIEDTLYNGVLPEASDVDGDTLTYTLKTQPTNGTVVVNEDGTYSYTPNENFYGQESLVYEVSDGELVSEATVTLNVAPVNDAPIASDTTVEAIEDTLYEGTLPQATDVDSDTLTYTLKTQPTNGTVVVNEDGTYSYTPNENFYGQESFVYEVSDGELVSEATITLNVASVNDAPIASDATVEAIEDTLYNGVLPEASDVDGDTLTYTLKTQPTNGTVVVNEDGTYSYTPNENFYGQESLVYEVSDGELVSEATVTLNVAPVNDAPIASDTTVEAIEDTLYEGTLPQATDVDSDTLTYTLKTQPTNGTVVVNEDGTYSYTPNENFYGQESLVYEVSDGELVSEATVTLNVAPVNDAPIASDTTVEAIEDTLYEGTLPQATDVDSDTLTYTLKTQPTNGTVVVNEDGTYSYTPNENFYGQESFVYEVSDGELVSEATITLNVASVNDAPIASDATVEAIEDTLYNGVLPEASDVDGDTLTYTLKTQPLNGTVVVNENGTYTYTPNENFYGQESFVYEVSDGELISEATVTLNVANVRDDLTIYGDNHNNILIGDGIDTGSFDTIYGFNGKDILKGLEGNDALYGGNGNDILYGGAGDDILDGGRGFDRMYGGSGDDIVYMDNSWLEYADGGAGNDTLSFAYSNHGVVTSVFGSAFGFFHCFGKGAINFENLEGSKYSDTLFGDNGDNSIYGNSGNDTIYGDDGNDILYGEEGRDTLFGGAGEDIFVFDTELSHLNIDRIMDFSSDDDMIYLDNEIFSKLIEEGTLSADNFTSNASGQAQDSDDYIIYESDTGRLFYDVDGNGNEAAMLIAQLGCGCSWNTPELTYEDIMVI